MVKIIKTNLKKSDQVQLNFTLMQQDFLDAILYMDKFVMMHCATFSKNKHFICTNNFEARRWKADGLCILNLDLLVQLWVYLCTKVFLKSTVQRLKHKPNSQQKV